MYKQLLHTVDYIDPKYKSMVKTLEEIDEIRDLFDKEMDNWEWRQYCTNN